MRKSLCLLSTLAGLLGLTGAGCKSNSIYPPSTGASPTADKEGRPSRVVLGESRLQADVCAGVDVRPETQTLDATDVIRFLTERGLSPRVVRARPDLVYIDLDSAGTKQPVRLRVAILPNAFQAARSLHIALLEHGSGAWGIHRSNLAILAPKGDVDAVVAFAAKTKLACFGVLTIADDDTAYVIPGGYTEL